MHMMIELVPFRVPNTLAQKTAPVARNEGFQPVPTYRLTEIPVEALDALCRKFRADVFKKAGRVDPEPIITKITT